MEVTGIFISIWGYLNANNGTTINRKKDAEKEEDHALEMTSIEKQLDQYYKKQRNFLLQGKRLEARLLKRRDKLNKRENPKAI